MTRAKALSEQADKSGAQRYAAADLQRAHDEFSNAERANGEKKYNDARRYAEGRCSRCGCGQCARGGRRRAGGRTRSCAGQ
jgi:hypothetical protein